MYIINPHRFRVINAFRYLVTVADNETISLPMLNGDDSLYDFVVDFGDGTGFKAVNAYADADREHTYTNAGTFEIKIPATGTFDYILFADSPDSIIELKEFGSSGVGTSSFLNCSNFDTLSAIDIPSIHLNNLTACFRNCIALDNVNDSINSWNVGSVTDMSSMFSGATLFNQNVDGWNVGSVTFMNNMFDGASVFNQSLNSWNVSSVVNMLQMFRNTNAFNGNISSWNVGSVTNMNGMFNNAIIFNSDISSWTLTAITVIKNIFNGATVFNSDISSWDVSNVSSFEGVFRFAEAFNIDISGWNTANVTDMNLMFADATSFDQDLGPWNITSMTTAANMFLNVTLSTANYDALLIGWEGQTEQLNVSFHGGNSLFTKSPSAAETARSVLISTSNWTIIDGGPTA